MSQREILFKAKRIDNGGWVEGWYCKETFGRWPVKPCIIPWENAENGYLEHVMVDGNTVCQYTGLNDKNGKKIWEGDILEWKRKDILAGGAYALTAKYRYGEKLVVRCLPAGFMLCELEDSFPYSPSANGKIDNYSFWNCQGFWEVVGNIHDN